MKKIFILFIVISLLLSSCKKNEINLLNLNNGENIQTYDDTLIKSTQLNFKNFESNPYKLLKNYDVRKILDENNLDYEFVSYIGKDMFNVYILLRDHNENFLIVGFSSYGQEQKVRMISDFFKADMISGFSIDERQNSAIYIFANDINADKTLNLNILKFDPLQSSKKSVDAIYKQDNVLKMSFVKLIENNSLGKIAFTTNKFNATENLFEDYIYTINLSDDTIDEIDKKQYKIENQNKYFGESITCIGGINTLYYQIVKLNGENLTSGQGEPVICWKSILSNTSTNKYFSFDKPVLFLSGREYFLITSDYCDENPEKNTGRYFSFGDSIYNIIPKINTGTDIQYVNLTNKNNNYIIFNGKDILLYDINENTYSLVDCVGNYKGDFLINQNALNQFSYIYSENDKPFIAIYEIDERTYLSEISDEIKENIALDLVSPKVKLLYENFEFAYYTEQRSEISNSTYKNIWIYEKRTKQSKKVSSYLYSMNDDIRINKDFKRIYININDENIVIDTESGSIIIE